MGRVSNARDRLLEAVQELIWTGSYGRTTVEQICQKARVRKGSFYHFFDSKADLAEASLEVMVARKQPIFDAIFSPVVPPLERLRRLCDQIFRDQAELKAKYGHVLGCPLFSLGSEVCTCESRLGERVRELLTRWRCYLETMVRDARAAGLIDAADPAATAQVLFAYHEGIHTQARIENSLAVFETLHRGSLQILGARESLKRAA